MLGTSPKCERFSNDLEFAVTPGTSVFRCRDTIAGKGKRFVYAWHDAPAAHQWPE
jgi:hypothetical protein